MRLENAETGTIYRRPDGTWYVNAVVKGRRNRISLRTRGEAEARLRAEALISEGRSFILAARARSKWKGVVLRGAQQRRGWIVDLHRRMMMRCEKKRWVSDITLEDLIALLIDSQGRCAFSGLEFNWHREPGWTSAPFAPSVDRIECARGYTKDNVRVVCTCVNAGLGQWGDFVLMKMCQAVVSAYS